LVSPRSRCAPTVRPTLLFFNRRFIRRYTGAWVLPVISVGGFSIVSNPNRARRRTRARTSPPCSPPVFFLVYARPRHLRWSSASAVGRRTSPPRSIFARRRRRTLARVWAAPRIPANNRGQELTDDHPGERELTHFIHSRSSSSITSLW
jgi:hypothetical protein